MKFQSMKKLLSVSLIAVFAFTACGKSEEEVATDRQSAYGTVVAATTCKVIQADNVYSKELAEEVEQMFMEAGFETDDDSLKILHASYQNDPDLQQRIFDDVFKCLEANGVDLDAVEFEVGDITELEVAPVVERAE